MRGKRECSVSTVFDLLFKIPNAPSKGFNWGQIYLLASSTQDIFGCCNWEVLLASSGKRPGMEADMAPCSGQPFTAKNYPSTGPILTRLRNAGLIQCQEHKWNRTLALY